MTFKSNMISRVLFAGLFALSANKDAFAQVRPLTTIPGPTVTVGATPPFADVMHSEYQLPDVQAVPLSTNEISALLSDLCSWSPARTRYATYFTLLPAWQDIKADMAQTVLADMSPMQRNFPYQPYNIAQCPNHSGFAVNVTRPSMYPWGINVAAASASRAYPFFWQQLVEVDMGQWVWVNLSGFPAAVIPIPVANVVESNFISGLVARLMLGQYAHAAGIPQSRLNFVRGTLPDFPAVAYENLANYVAPPPAAANYADAYQRAIQRILITNPVEPSSLLLGWEAGEDLTALTGGDARYRTDVWRLIQQRFGPEKLGEMTAFALSYLSGYFSSQRITAIAAGQHPAPVIDLAQIFLSRDQNSLAGQSSSMLAGFGSAVLGEFYFVAQHPELGAKRDTILARDADFAVGLQAGGAMAMNVLLEDVFALAYGLGQNDGYNEGYAAGESDGYAHGYKDAQATFQQMSSSGGIWNTLGKVETAAGAIASIAYFAAAVF